MRICSAYNPVSSRVWWCVCRYRVVGGADRRFVNAPSPSLPPLSPRLARLGLRLGRPPTSSPHPNGESRPETALAAVCRILRVDVCTITTPRAGARTTSQTSVVYGPFGQVEGAHPCMLLDLLRRNRIALSRWVLWYRLPHSAGWRWAAIRRVSHVAIGWRGSAVAAAELRAIGVSRGLACSAREGSVHVATAKLQFVQSR